MSFERSDFRKRVAAKLSKKYIDEDAKLQINISGKVRTRILGDLSTAGRLIFQQAQDEVFTLMQSGVAKGDDVATMSLLMILHSPLCN